MPATKLIVNADDLGASRLVNHAAFALIADGRITSATLMANGPAIEEATVFARGCPQCSFGVHLNLTEFFPLSGHQDLGVLLDQNGSFSRTAPRSARLTARTRAAVFIELSAQVQRLLALGIPISHFDSHHHIHTRPGLFGVIKRLQRRFRIRKVRISMNLYTEPQPRLRRVRKALWNAALRAIYRTTTTAAFTSLKVFVGVADRFSCPPRSVELMVHPGRDTFAAETQLLDAEIWSTFPFRTTLISYNDLGCPSRGGLLRSKVV